ncbi:MAG TPA: ABC transporter ATP-binding protein [Mycobacteriales bacterium]|nr:ABC transporter ATP-binding protein [Mycobacteriales bacterium]
MGAPGDGAAFLRMSGVSKHFQRGREVVAAVNDVSVEIAAGEFVSVIGPSGSGKSTLLHLAGGLDKPDSGEVWVDGENIATLSAAALARLRRRQVGFVFQFFHLIPNLTVRENVTLPVVLDGGSQADGRVDELIDRVGLSARARHLPGELSGGEMQRVAIARALVNQPQLILADEPTGNLDRATGGEILAVLEEQVAQAGAALLMVTHDETAAGRADRTLHVVDGRLTDKRRTPATRG